MISFVVCSIDPAKFTALSQNLAEKMAGETYELIGIHNARSLCEGYNRGVARAKGEAIVFCHDDIEILADGFAQRLIGHLRHYDVVGVAGTDKLVGGLWSLAGPPHLFGQIATPKGGGFQVQIFNVPGRSVGRIQAVDGLFFAAKRAVVEKIRFDEETFDGFHLYDLDFTYAAFLAGFQLGVACDLYILHNSGGSPDQVFMQYAHRFNAKYRSHLFHSDASLIKQRKSQTGLAWVPTKTEIVDVMTPHYFQ